MDVVNQTDENDDRKSRNNSASATDKERRVEDKESNSNDTIHQGKQNYHGPPSTLSRSQPPWPTALRDDRYENLPENAELAIKRKDELIDQMKRDLQTSFGKIKGYETLGQLYHEAKQECKVYKQKNEEMAGKLDVLMKCLSPDRDVFARVVTNVAPFRDENPSSPVATKPAKEKNFNLEGLLRSEAFRKPDDAAVKRREEYDDDDAVKSLTFPIPSVDDSDEKSKAIDEENDETTTIAKEKSDKTPSGSSVNSPSFVRIGSSELSSFEQSPTLREEENKSLTTGNRPLVVDESTMDLKSLNECLNDPNNSPELRAMAYDLLRVGNRAMKIEKQARVQQVLLHELDGEKAALIRENEQQKQELQDLQNKFELVCVKMPEMEVKDLSLNPSGHSTMDWVEVGKFKDSESLSLTMQTVVDVQTKNHEQLRSRMRDMEIVNRSLTDGLRHSQQKNEELSVDLQMKMKQLQEFNENDLCRQQDFDTMLLSSKKRREELESEKEELEREFLSERRRRAEAEEKGAAAVEHAAHLESKIHELRRQFSLNTVVEATRFQDTSGGIPPVKHSDTTSSSPSSGSRGSIGTELAILQQQVTIYKEDFDHERRDRELAQSQINSLNSQLSEVEGERDRAQRQVVVLTDELSKTKSENAKLKTKFRQAVDEIKIFQRQIKPASKVEAYATPAQPVYQQLLSDKKWFCQRCTFENLGIRQSCEMCGALCIKTHGAYAASSFQAPSLEPLRDLMGRSAVNLKNNEDASGVQNPLEEDKSLRHRSTSPRWQQQF